MARRRAPGEGLIRHRADGRWEARITLADGISRSFYAKTRQEVLVKLRTAQHDQQAGLPIVEERQTVADYLTGWLDTIRPPRLVQETWNRYEECVRLHINPGIGSVRLAQLSAQRVQTLYAQCASKGLSPTTVKHVHAVLHRALEQALRLSLVQRNVSDMVEKPRRRVVEMRPLSREQAQAYLAAAANDRLEAVFVLAIATGMRVGELLALRWADVDLEPHAPAGNGTISVNATLKWRDGQAVWAAPKSQYSRRLIAIAPPVIERLKRHRVLQRLERVAAGPAWQDYDLVFCDEIGGPLKGDMLRHRHERFLASAHLPRIRPHDLRHTCATILLSQGVNPKVVSSMLGHSSVAITLDIYSHVLPHMLDDAAAALMVALGW